jgi:hypothetical protein
MRFVMAILAAIFTIGTASAADVYPSAKDTPAYVMPSATASQSWTGIWGAALLGYDMSNTGLSLNALFSEGENEPTWHRDVAKVDGIGGEGFTGTLQLGGDYQFGRAVVGGWGEYTFGGTEAGAGIAGLGKLTWEQQDSYGAFVRAGIASGDTLIYGAGGYVWTSFDAKFTGTDFGGKASFDFSGPAAELGVEHRFGQNIRGKLSARYTWLDDERLIEGDNLRLNAEPGILSIKAGVVISTGQGMGILGQ